MPAGNNFAEQRHDEPEDILASDEGLYVTSDKTPGNASRSRGMIVGEPCNQTDALLPKTLAESFSHAPEYCRRINGFFSEEAISQKVEETALPALKLHLFNFLLQHPDATEEELEEEFAKINRLSNIEREFSEEGNPLPTIGIEIELPRTHLSQERVEILTQLGIPNEDALDWPAPSKLWEVNPSFSYSPWVPARVLQELSVVGAVPLEDDNGNRSPRIPKDNAFSLHVNFGIPDGLEGGMLEEKRESFFLLNDCLTYAFATQKRLLNRKTLRSLYIGKTAIKNKKSKMENGGNFVSDEESVGDEALGQSGPRRVELRAMEFRDYPTFRMLAESQKLMAMLFGSLRYDQNNERDTRTEALALLWVGFEEEVSQRFAQHEIPLKIVDENKERAAEILEQTDLKQWCRSIVQRYAREVAKVITQKTDR